jgi:hypothetical protein
MKLPQFRRVLLTDGFWSTRKSRRLSGSRGADHAEPRTAPKLPDSVEPGGAQDRGNGVIRHCPYFVTSCPYFVPYFVPTSCTSCPVPTSRLLPVTWFPRHLVPSLPGKRDRRPNPEGGVFARPGGRAAVAAADSRVGEWAGLRSARLVGASGAPTRRYDQTACALYPIGYN